MTFKEIIYKNTDNVSSEDMELLTSITDNFIEKIRHHHPEEVEAFLAELNGEFSKHLTFEEAKYCVDHLENEDQDHPRGEMWGIDEAVKAFTSSGYPQESEKYNEAEVYYTLNMVYSDYFPMYRENIKSYVDHAYLFLNDKDYKGRYSKAKWYSMRK